MIVTIISECEKKAWIKTRRILSGYLPQIGRRTWSGHISKEGLGDLKDALISARSRQMAVICHRHRGTQKPVVEWTVGSQVDFSEDGLYAYRTRRHIPDDQLTQSRFLNSLWPLVRLAGYFHDLGKANQHFQQKLSVSVGNTGSPKGIADPARHELLSAVFLAPLLSEPDGLRCLTTKEGVRDYFRDRALAGYEEFLAQFEQAEQITKQMDADDSVLRENTRIPMATDILGFSAWQKRKDVAALLWLVITHHQLPDGEAVEKNVAKGRRRNLVQIIEPVSDPYFHPKKCDNVKEQLKLTHAMPWENESWQLAVANAAQEFISAGGDASWPDGRIDTNNELAAALLYLARPALVYADYIESIGKEVCALQDPSALLYANTALDESGTIAWADTLLTHLKKVGETSGVYFRELVLAGPGNDHTLPRLAQAGLPEPMRTPDTCDESSRFYWQRKIHEGLQASAPERGFFGVLCAKTGAGKTKASPIIMSNLGDSTRFTLALGMRSLTMQSYLSYLSPLIGFKPEQTALLIGSSALVSKEINDAMGSANHAMNDEDDLSVIGGSVDTSSELGLMYSNDKMVNLLSSPVSVMTVDHLVGAVNQTRASDSKLLWHVANTDLVLDEIDDYDPSDLRALGKLIYAFGLYGRNVLISSATTSPQIIEALMSAYHQGYSNYRAWYDGPEATYAFMSHAAPYLSTVTGYQHAYDQYLTFERIVANDALAAPKRHQPTMVDISGDEGYSLSRLDDAVQAFHTLHGQVVEDVTLSMGFVRFNNVVSAQTYAQHLLTAEFPEDTLVKVMCYHSKMLTLDRFVIEEFLNTTLKRGDPDPLPNQPIIRALLEQAREEGRRHVIVIVSTTNIQETGRDHDYDWIICEPNSDRSLIQSAGRVWRHRPDKVCASDAGNVGVLTRTLKGYAGAPYPWSFPGIETEKLANRTARYPVLEALPTRLAPQVERLGLVEACRDDGAPVFEAQAALDQELFDQGIFACSATKKVEVFTDTRLGTLERIRANDLLLNVRGVNDPRCFDLSSYTHRGDVLLSRLHWRKTKFRASTGRQVHLFQRNLHRNTLSAGAWEATINGDPGHVEVSHAYTHNPRILFSYSFDDELSRLQDVFDDHSEGFCRKLSGANFTVYVDNFTVEYDTFLGLIVEEVQ